MAGRWLGPKCHWVGGQAVRQAGGVGGEHLLYKIRGCPIQDTRTTPPSSSSREAHPGAAPDPPLQPEGDPAPSQPPGGAIGKAGALPQKEEADGRTPLAPGLPQERPPCPHASPPHPHHSPTADSATGRAAPVRASSRRLSISCPASSQGAGRAPLGWPRQTPSSGPAASGPSTPGT